LDVESNFLCRREDIDRGVFSWLRSWALELGFGVWLRSFR
jgi:hypothetical protein